MDLQHWYDHELSASVNVHVHNHVLFAGENGLKLEKTLGVRQIERFTFSKLFAIGFRFRFGHSGVFERFFELSLWSTNIAKLSFNFY